MTTDWSARLSGVDPFDALRGTRVPSWIRRHPRLRQALVQVRKRLPIDLSPLLGITPFIMAKSAGAFLAARSRSDDGLSRGDCEAIEGVLRNAEGCLGSGRFGYEFDVQTRWAFYPAGSPNLIATVFCARGLGEAGVVHDRRDWLAEMAASARWVQSELTDAQSGFIRYVAGSDRLIHNANALGAGLLATAGVLLGDSEMVDAAERAAVVTSQAQLVGSGWPYGDGPGLDWQDNFHTAYTLDGLLQVWLATRNPEIANALESGVASWERSFFGADGAPWFGPGRVHPLDIHSAGTAVDVASRLSSWGLMTTDLARRVASWTQANLVGPAGGYTYARLMRLGTDKRHFVRWGDAHWALGDSALGMMERGERVSLERMVDARRRPATRDGQGGRG